MNKNQKLTLKIMIFLIVVMCLFPPFQYYDSAITFNEGYSFIFQPPRKGGVMINHKYVRIYANVNIAMLIVQWVGVLIVGGLALFLFNDKSTNTLMKDECLSDDLVKLAVVKDEDINMIFQSPINVNDNSVKAEKNKTIFRIFSPLLFLSVIFISILLFLGNANGFAPDTVIKILTDKTLRFIFHGISGCLIFWHLIMKKKIKGNDFFIKQSTIAIGGVFIAFFLACTTSVITLYFGGEYFNSISTGKDGEIRGLILFSVLSLMVTYFLRCRFAEEEIKN